MAGPATGPLAGYQDAGSVAARGATVAASGLFCHATIAEQQQQLGAPDTPRYTTLQQQQQQGPGSSSSAPLLLPPGRRTRLISHLANLSFPNRPKSRLPISHHSMASLKYLGWVLSQYGHNMNRIWGPGPIIGSTFCLSHLNWAISVGTKTL